MRRLLAWFYENDYDYYSNDHDSLIEDRINRNYFDDNDGVFLDG